MLVICPKCKKTKQFLIVREKTGAKKCADCAKAVVESPLEHPLGVFTLDSIEEDMIRQAVDAYPSHSECARQLGITRATLYAKKKKYNIH